MIRSMPIMILTLLVLRSIPSCEGPPQPSPEELEFVAHRGASHIAPENTLSSIELAWEKNADAVEVDVRMTADERIILMHDKTTERTTDQTLTVKETPYDRIAELDAGSWKDERYKGEKVPLLEEALDAVPQGKEIYIEVKSGMGSIPPLAKILSNNKEAREKASVIGFDRETMALVKKKLPEIPVYWVKGWKAPWRDIISKAQKDGFAGFHLYKGSVRGSFVKKAKEHGFKVFSWTVNDPEKAAELQEKGVHGITTDRPGYLRNELKAMASMEKGVRLDTTRTGSDSL